MGIGIQREFEQNASLHDYFSHCGEGMLGIGGDSTRVPDGAVEFCVEQYKRFNIPLPPKEVIEVGAHAMFMTIDCIDPYCLFFAGIGVEVSNDWQEYSYMVKDLHARKDFPADPEFLETFRLIHGTVGQARDWFLSNPGMANLPDYAKEGIEGVLDGEWMGEDAIGQLSSESESQLRNLCMNFDGTIDGKKIEAYFDLAAWASWCWLYTDGGQDFLFCNHDIFYLCGEHGECVLYEGVPLDPHNYTKTNRPPQSCEICGIDAWCVDLVMLKGGSRFICEHHLNGDAPLYEGATCGSKACRHVECHHHPFHGQEAGLAQTLRLTGQLVHMSKGGRELLDSNRNNVKQITS